MPHQPAPDPGVHQPDRKNLLSNRLIREKSPYLLQHAHNPVDWYPWGDEAFSRAARENKPIFLSIGYSTCHWCHVMAHESFDDTTLAALLNREFVNIKVDREERPDIDSVYMTVCQQMTGQGGWPLTIIMTPEKKPFFAGTYFPKDTKAGMPGLKDILERIADLWHGQPEELPRLAGEIAEMIRTALPGPRDPDRELADRGFRELAAQFDPKNAGFGHAPKFPAPHIIIFLIRYWHLSGDPYALEMAEQTLDALYRGGIRDHLGLGIHRYATDARWRIPHFEKMLYDQALVVLACTEAYAATRKEKYRLFAEECIEYVLCNLRDPGGAFYLAEDADSPGGEGAFYTWTYSELAEVLGTDDAAFAAAIFTLTPLPGEHAGHGIPVGDNCPQRFILSSAGPDTFLAQATGLSETEFVRRRKVLIDRLSAAQKMRARPARDDKILTDINALFCTALARAGRIYANPSCISAARQAVDFLLLHVQDKNCHLCHRYRDGERAIPGFADDYACMASALIEVYEATFDGTYLHAALGFAEVLIQEFEDRGNGGFFTTSNHAEELPVRKKEWYDGAVPSANATAFEVLTHLFRLTKKPELGQAAVRCARFLAGASGPAPASASAFLAGLIVSPALGDTQDLVIAGDSRRVDTKRLLDAVNSQYLPGLLVFLTPGKTPGPAEGNGDNRFPGTERYIARGGQATAYLCSKMTCHPPVSDPASLLLLLDCKNRA
ncbi:MAG: thioredoxin domain-containing protein [Methanoregula sp.]|nr:thioredoxin domain-containing protein [Methanoregula sp.]